MLVLKATCIRQHTMTYACVAGEVHLLPALSFIARVSTPCAAVHALARRARPPPSVSIRQHTRQHTSAYALARRAAAAAPTSAPAAAARRRRRRRRRGRLGGGRGGREVGGEEGAEGGLVEAPGWLHPQLPAWLNAHGMPRGRACGSTEEVVVEEEEVACADAAGVHADAARGNADAVNIRRHTSAYADAGVDAKDALEEGALKLHHCLLKVQQVDGQDSLGGGCGGGGDGGALTVGDAVDGLYSNGEWYRATLLSVNATGGQRLKRVLIVP